jgi:hypothetical protein
LLGVWPPKPASSKSSMCGDRMVSKYSEGERVFMKELIKDCINWNLKESEALEYIRSKFNRELSSSTYNRYKSAVISDKTVTAWYNRFVRVGLLVEHKLAMERIKAQIHTLQRMFAAESFKPEDPSDEHCPRSTWKDKRLMLSISDRLVTLEISLEQFRLGNEVYLKMRENLDKLKEVHEKYFTAQSSYSPHRLLSGK